MKLTNLEFIELMALAPKEIPEDFMPIVKEDEHLDPIILRKEYIKEREYEFNEKYKRDLEERPIKWKIHWAEIAEKLILKSREVSPEQLQNYCNAVIENYKNVAI